MVLYLNILSLAQLDEHLGSWVDNSHLIQDSGAVIGDSHFSFCILDHLVHTPEIKVEQLELTLILILC